MQLGLGLANAMAHHAACKSNEMILSLNFHLCGIHVTLSEARSRDSDCANKQEQTDQRCKTRCPPSGFSVSTLTFDSRSKTGFVSFVGQANGPPR